MAHLVAVDREINGLTRSQMNRVAPSVTVGKAPDGEKLHDIHY